MYDIDKTLYDSGIIAKKEMDDMEAKLKNAQYQMEQANDSLKILKSKVIPETVDVANTQVRQAQVAVDLASTQIDNATVVSPITGVVSMRNIDEGELISNMIPVFTIININTLIAEVNIPVTTAVKLKKGQNVSLKINTINNRDFQGTIDTISPSADSKTQLYIVKIKIDNTNEAIKAGLFTKVILTEEEKDKVLIVPNEAVIIENSVPYLYMVKDGAVKKTVIVTGISDDKITEVTSGMSEGDNVIIEGQSFLNDGEKVNMIK